MNMQKAVILFEKIRDLPYGTSGNNGMWSCYQKCVYLQRELQKVDIASQLLIGVFNWQDLPIPDRILKLRQCRNERHIMLRVFIDGSVCNIDPSIDNKLVSILPIAQWDGISSTITIAPLKRLRIYKPHSLHERILSRLRHQLSGCNPEKFYTELDAWLAAHRIKSGLTGQEQER